MYSASAGSQASIGLLLENGADVTAKNTNGSTALHMAIGHGADLPTIELLLHAGASAQVETPNDSGYTPIRVASERGREDVVELLRKVQTKPA